jgi:hypothetical protein
MGDQINRYAAVREFIKLACIQCVDLTPCSPEQTRAINHMHMAMMMFNAAIAINEVQIQPEGKLVGELNDQSKLHVPLPAPT